MSIVEPGHFLLSVVNSAEDVSLLMETYNVSTADDVLRNAVTLSEKPLLLFGSSKRHDMCRRKLPNKFKELNLKYNEDSVHYVTEDNLKEFVTEALAKLYTSNTINEVEVEELLDSEAVIATAPEQVEAQVSLEYRETEVVEDEVEVVPIVEPEEVPQNIPIEGTEHFTPDSSVTSSGLCRYGVPKLHVQYMAPSVLGLKESLFVNVEEDDINKFFETVKSRVLKSVSK